MGIGLLLLFFYQFFINFLSLGSIYLRKISIFKFVLREVLLYCVSWSVTVSLIIVSFVYFIQFFHAGIVLRAWLAMAFFAVVSRSIGIGAFQNRFKKWIIVVIFQFLLNIADSIANFVDIRFCRCTKILDRVRFTLNFVQIWLVVSQRFQGIHTKRVHAFFDKLRDGVIRMNDFCFALHFNSWLKKLAIIVEMAVCLVSSVFGQLAAYVVVNLNRRVFMLFLIY